jgi:hypothetical protein
MISIRYGVDIGRLNIYIRTFVSSNFTSETLIWALPGPQGQEWKHGLVPLQPSGRYQIIIEGLRGKSYEGDIALDDIGVLPTGACALTPSDADPIQASYQAVSCSFEDNFCQWEFDPTGQFNWTRHTENTGSIDTGPSSGTKMSKFNISIFCFRDFLGAQGTAYYIYIEASYPQKDGDRAGLSSPVIPTSKRPMCFQFYYHM